MAAEESARATGRGEPNVEDQIRAALELLRGLRILVRTDTGQTALLKACENDLNKKLNGLLTAVLQTEQKLEGAFGSPDEQGKQLRRYLGSFLLSFASRTATRDTG